MASQDQAKAAPQKQVRTGREATQFKPGQSGNPAGRPKKAIRNLAENIRDQVGDNGELLVSIMIQHATGWRFMVNPATEITQEMRDDPANWERVSVAEQQAALRWLAERGWGKPQEFVPVEEDTLGLSIMDEQDASMVAALYRQADELAAKRREREERDQAAASDG
jgi:Family of unknown function (DUF5681)